MNEVQWKRYGMVHILRPGSEAVYCGANKYAGQVYGSTRNYHWDTNPAPDMHRCRKCIRLAKEKP